MMCSKCGSQNLGHYKDFDGIDKEEIWMCYNCNKILEPEDIWYDDDELYGTLQEIIIKKRKK